MIVGTFPCNNNMKSPYTFVNNFWNNNYLDNRRSRTFQPQIHITIRQLYKFKRVINDKDGRVGNVIMYYIPRFYYAFTNIMGQLLLTMRRTFKLSFSNTYVTYTEKFLGIKNCK